MKRLIGLLVVTSLVAVAGVATTTNPAQASDHDDGENDSKERSLNLTDHFTFKSADAPDNLTLIMYFNPRALPGKQYFLNTKARYEFHVSKVAANTDAGSVNENFVFRFEAAAPDAAGVQAVTTTVIKDGAVLGTHDGNTTGFADSKAGTITTNTGTVGGVSLKYFIGMRADSFTFDVVRFFQVRAFLADRFFGGAGGIGNPTAGIAPNCKGQALLAGVLGSAENDGDEVNLFNPPECAPDFTKNYNVTAIVLNVPIANLGGTIFDTWSTVSVAN